MNPIRPRAGVRSLALGFPSLRRTNTYWVRHFPDLVGRAEHLGLARIWLRPEHETRSTFDRAMDPFRRDPFLGSVERRIRAPGETALSMELRAARGALDAAGLGPADVDLTLVSSFVGDRLGVGDAPFLAAELGLAGPAVNFESACSGSLVGLTLASSLVASGERRRVLVVVSTSNSLQVRDDDSIGWFVGDGAGAFVVEAADPEHGVLGWHVLNSVDTNDMFVIHSVPDGDHGTRLETLGTPRSGAIARSTAEPYLLTPVRGALAHAGLGLEDIDFFVFNTPTAWYADFCATALGVPEGRFHSVYPRYANIGAALMPATLYHALHEGRVSAGDRVLLYSIGSSSTAAAVVLRVGEIALGPFPTPPEVPDADALERPPEARSVAAAPVGGAAAYARPPRVGGRAAGSEVRALAERIWGADPIPERVARAVAGSLEDPADAVPEEVLATPFSFDHALDLGGGQRVFVRERFTLRSLLASPRRAVVLLPGPVSNQGLFELDLDGYRLQSELAAAGFFVFGPDYPGAGQSSAPPDGFALTHGVLVDQLRVVVAAVRELRWLPPVDLIGESMGAAIAAELADDDRAIRSCVLSAVLYRVGTPMMRQVFQDRRFVEYLRSRPGGYLDVGADYYGNIVARSTPPVAEEVLRTQPGRFSVAPLLEPLGLPWFDPTRARVPALVLQGAEDNIAARSDVHALAEAYGREGGGRARAVVLDGAGHIPRMEPPPVSDRWKAAVMRFLLAGGQPMVSEPSEHPAEAERIGREDP